MAYQTCFFYNLESAVGRDAPNHYSDVLVVESLLEIFFKCKSVEMWRRDYTPHWALRH